MTLPTGGDLDAFKVRQAAMSIVIHGLMDRMIAKGLLDGPDIDAIRSYALDMARDLQDAAGTQERAFGIRLGEEVEAFLGVLAGEGSGG